MLLVLTGVTAISVALLAYVNELTKALSPKRMRRR